MAAKAVAVVPQDAAEVVLTPAEVFDVITQASDMMSQHDEAIDALREAQASGDKALWQTAWSAAQSNFVGETDRLDSAVKRAQDIVKAGRKASDAHSDYRVRLVGAYVAHNGQAVSDADVARAVYGEDSNARRKQIGRDRLAIKVLAAAVKAKAKHSDYEVPTINKALTAVNKGTVAEAKEVVRRAAEGQALLPDSGEVTLVKAATAIRRAESMVEALKHLDTESLTDETAATLRTLIGEISGLVANVTVVSKASDAATSTK